MNTFQCEGQNNRILYNKWKFNVNWRISRDIIHNEKAKYKEKYFLMFEFYVIVQKINQMGDIRQTSLCH